MPFWQLYYHVVWCTHSREPLITADIEPVVHHAIREAAGRHGMTVHALGGIEDHIHLAVEAPPTLELASVIGRIKGSSSYSINQRLHGRAEFAFRWQSEYGVISLSRAQLASLCRYIESQRERHARGDTRPVLEHVDAATRP